MSLPKINITTRLIIVCLGVCLIPLIVVSVIGISMTLKTLEASSFSSLQASASLQKNQIETNLRKVVKDVIFLSELHSLTRHLSDDQDMLINSRREFLEFNKSRPEYYQVRFLGSVGHEIMRANFKNNSFFLTAENELQYKGNRYYFQQGINQSKGSVYFSPIDFNIEHGKIETPRQLVMRIAAPVYYRQEKRGVIVINMFAKEFFKWMKLPGTPFISFLLDKSGKVLYMEKNNNQYEFGVAVGEGTNLFNLYPSLKEEDAEFLDKKVVNQKNVVIASYPIQGDGNFNYPAWKLVTILPKSHFDPKLNIFKLNFIVALIGAVIAATMIAMMLSRYFTKSIKEIYEDINLVSEGHLDNNLKITTGDEFEDLAKRVNRMKYQLRNRHTYFMDTTSNLEEELRKSMAEIRELERQLYKADKLASLGELSMGLAHEIGNPLASIKTVAQALSEEGEERGERSSHFERIVSEVDRLNNFLKKFNNFAVSKDIDPVPCDIYELVRDVTFFLRIQAKEKGVSVNETFESGINKIMLDPQQLKQVMVNLILNSIQATQSGGSINVTVRASKESCSCNLREDCFCKNEGHFPENADFIELTVCDNGQGVPEDKLIKIFDPFYSTKPNGTGLGLSVVHRIVEQHLGVIKAYSKKGMGTTFKIYLPKIYSEFT